MTQLTDTELRVLALMALPLKLAAHRLDVHVNTVKMHHRNIERKLGAANRMSACVIAAQSGFSIEAMRT